MTGCNYGCQQLSNVQSLLSCHTHYTEPYRGCQPQQRWMAMFVHSLLKLVLYLKAPKYFDYFSLTSRRFAKLVVAPLGFVSQSVPSDSAPTASTSGDWNQHYHVVATPFCLSLIPAVWPSFTLQPNLGSPLQLILWWSQLSLAHLTCWVGRVYTKYLKSTRDIDWCGKHGPCLCHYCRNNIRSDYPSRMVDDVRVAYMTPSGFKIWLDIILAG